MAFLEPGGRIDRFVDGDAAERILRTPRAIVVMDADAGTPQDRLKFTS